MHTFPMRKGAVSLFYVFLLLFLFQCVPVAMCVQVTF